MVFFSPDCEVPLVGYFYFDKVLFSCSGKVRWSERKFQNESHPEQNITIENIKNIIFLILYYSW